MPNEVLISLLGLLNGPSLMVKLSIRLILILWRTPSNVVIILELRASPEVVPLVTLMSVAVNTLLSTTFKLRLTVLSRALAENV